MNLIKYLIDYHDKGHMEHNRIWAKYDATDATGHCMKPTGVDSEQITWSGWRWSIHFQYALKIIFEDDTEMVFKGGPKATDKKNESGVDLVTFLKDYMKNGYELPTSDQDYIELDDLVL